MRLLPKYQGGGKERDVTAEVAGLRKDQPTQTWFDNYYHKPWSLQDRYLQSLYDYLKNGGDKQLAARPQQGNPAAAQQPSTPTSGIPADGTSVGGPQPLSLTPPPGTSTTTVGGAGTSPASGGSWYGQPIFKVDATQGIARDTSLDGNINLPSNGAWNFDVDRSALGTPPVIDSRTGGQYKVDAANNFKVDAAKTYRIPEPFKMPNISIIPPILNYIIGRKNIDKVRDLAKSRKLLPIAEAQLPIWVKKDLSPELLAKMESDLASNFRSGAGSSDPAEMAILKNQAAQERRLANEANIATRAEFLADQDQKVYDSRYKSAERKAADQEKATLRQQEDLDLKLKADIQHREALKDLTAKFIPAISSARWQARAPYELATLGMAKQDIATDYENAIKAAALIQDESQRLLAVQNAKKAYDEDMENIAGYAAKRYPSYGQAETTGIWGDWGKRLVARRNAPPPIAPTTTSTT